MPGLDGFETESELAHRGFRIPVVVLTGREMPGDRERSMEGGATAFLLKPVDAQALLAAIGLWSISPKSNSAAD